SLLKKGAKKRGVGGIATSASPPRNDSLFFAPRNDSLFFQRLRGGARSAILDLPYKPITGGGAT
ncbi:MAG: hypothetical protein IKS66_05345, partial [Oscillospiraceae bacterium]|nr:hypothetical protein [Oscillospiraceae bacterium]